MIYCLDTEFWERGPDYPVELISIGIVNEGTRKYYAVNAEFNWSRVPEDHWLQKNVRPYLGDSFKVLRSRDQIKSDLLKFFVTDKKPEFWAYFADYDWVVFCQIFGSMIDLPDGWPMMCMDINQLRKHLGLDRRVMPTQTSQEHNALNDAEWDMEALKVLRSCQMSPGRV